LVTFSASFFEASAQIIPVLFLALVLEDKLRPGKRDGARERVAHSWVLALLVAGEIITLSVVAGGLKPSGSVGQLVGLCMLFPAFLIALPAIAMQIKKKASQRERLGHATAGLAVIATILGVVAALALQNS
jgi:hypothetical protein